MKPAGDSGPSDGTIDWSGEDGRAAKGPRSSSVVTLPVFERGLIEHGLIDADGLRSFRDGLPPGVRPDDAEGLAVALVRDGRLTRYQASAILQGKAKVLAIGPYVILDRVGTGGMGLVFKARNRDFVEILALKVLPPSASKKEEAVQRFRREARMLARLDHPNLVTSHDIGEYNGVHFLVMDYVEGFDLRRIVRSGGPMRASRSVDVIIQAARGLAAAHEAGIIHRDIKPANLMVDSRGTVRVLDLGLARFGQSGSGSNAPDDEMSLTRSGIIMGTVDFLSPEQSKDSKRADHRSDIYSLGCTLHFLLTGRPPYPRETVMQGLLAHHQDPIPSLRDSRPEIPPELDSAFRKMLAKDPADRQQSMADVVKSLEACRAAKGDGRVLLVFNDRPKPEPDREPSPIPIPIPAPAAREAEDLSSYDLIPPAASELWKPGESSTFTPSPHPSQPKGEGESPWRSILMAVAAAVLTSAILAAYLGSRSRSNRPPPPPPPRTAPSPE